MDIKATAQNYITNNQRYEWDITLDGDGNIVTVNEDFELLQRARIAVFLQYGLIPQLPEVGIAWSEYFGGALSFGELDAELNQALRDVDVTNYYVDYDFTNDGLAVNVERR